VRDSGREGGRLACADDRVGFRATSLEPLRRMVAAGVGITLLPVLAVQPPVPPPPDIALVPFERPAPHRRIAMVWRRSSAMDGFLRKLAGEFARLPAGLLEPPRNGPIRS